MEGDRAYVLQVPPTTEKNDARYVLLARFGFFDSTLLPNIRSKSTRLFTPKDCGAEDTSSG